jgi:hypothetical protein
VDTTWIAPSAVLGIGAAAAAALLRAIARATDEAQAAHRRFRRLEDGLIPLRVETRRTRDSLDRMRRR